MLAAALLLVASTPAPDAINAVLGDASWVERYGAPPLGASSEERIVVHLANVEARLRVNLDPSWSPEQRANREALLDVLADYRARGEFPRRTSDAYVGRRPRFIDDRGVHCAVGHLVAASGYAALAAGIDARFEYAYVADMDAPELVAWADVHGFTIDELATIQPGYSPVPTAESTRSALFGSADGITLKCAAKHRPTRSVHVRVTGLDDASVDVSTPSMDPFAACFAELASKLERGGGAYSETIHTYSFETRIPIRSPQRILDERAAQVRLGSHDTSCTPRPGPRVDAVRFAIDVGDDGARATVTTTPANEEVTKCLDAYLEHAFSMFGPGQWRLHVEGRRTIEPRLNAELFRRWVGHEAKYRAPDCADAKAPFTLRVKASARRGGDLAFVIEGGDEALAECLVARLDEALRRNLSVSRAKADGTYERYFAIDADAEVSVDVEVETRAARDARNKATRERMEREMNRVDF